MHERFLELVEIPDLGVEDVKRPKRQMGLFDWLLGRREKRRARGLERIDRIRQDRASKSIRDHEGVEDLVSETADTLSSVDWMNIIHTSTQHPAHHDSGHHNTTQHHEGGATTHHDSGTSHTDGGSHGGSDSGGGGSSDGGGGGGE